MLTAKDFDDGFVSTFRETIEFSEGSKENKFGYICIISMIYSPLANKNYPTLYESVSP